MKKESRAIENLNKHLEKYEAELTEYVDFPTFYSPNLFAVEGLTVKDIEEVFNESIKRNLGIEPTGIYGNLNLLQLASCTGKIHLIDYLLTKVGGLNINETNNSEPPLILALNNSSIEDAEGRASLEIAALLIHYGADLEYTSSFTKKNGFELIEERGIEQELNKAVIELGLTRRR